MIKQKNFSSLFFNTCFDKNQLKNLIAWILDTYGEKSTVDFLETLKQVGFHEATQAGVSLGLEDLQIPAQKSGLIARSLLETKYVNNKSFSGSMTGVEKSQQMIDIWNQMSETLRQTAVQNFRNTNPVNPIFMMAFSGARGNISQVRQLVAMRGLMADPQGAIVEFPIQSNFREGLTITEYLISCYGARKGLVDTALRTATSGYLTRRLVDAVQHIVVTIADCKTTKGMFLKKHLDSRLIGRVLAENIVLEKNHIIKKNEIISPKLAKLIASKYTTVLVRSPLTCEAHKAICQLCYGGDLAHGILVNIGEAVGVIAAQSIGEPGTQLTMRTFHTGGVGVFGDQATKPIFSPFDGIVEFPEELIGHFVRTPHGNILYMVKYLPLNPSRPVLKIKPIDSFYNSFIIEEKELPAGSLLLIRQNEYVKSGQLVAQSSQIKTSKQEMPESTHPIKSTIDGEIFFESMLIWTQKNLPIKTKEDTIKEISIFPDIRTLGQLGSFWVFSSCNQKESYFLNPFLRAGDLVSPESFLFNYQFKIGQKTQLKILNNKLIIGQPWNQMPLKEVRFHKFGYSLNFSSIFSKNPARKTDLNSSLKTKRELNSQTIFYIKNSPLFDKKQFLIWFPDSLSLLRTYLKSSTNNNYLLKQNKQNDFPIKNWIPKKSFRLTVWHENPTLLQTSYFSILKNYSANQYFSFQDFQKEYFDYLNFSSRTIKFVNKYSLLSFKPNKFGLENLLYQNTKYFGKGRDNYKKLAFTLTLLKACLNDVQSKKSTSFFFLYNQHLVNAHSTFLFTKKYSVKRNFKIINRKTEGYFKKSKKQSFLLKTLTKSQFSLFEKINTTHHPLLSCETTWVYIPSDFDVLSKKDSPLKEGVFGTTSKLVFLERGKKFENFLFSNLPILLKIVQGNIIKLFPSQIKKSPVVDKSREAPLDLNFSSGNKKQRILNDSYVFYSRLQLVNYPLNPKVLKKQQSRTKPYWYQFKKKQLNLKHDQLVSCTQLVGKGVNFKFQTHDQNFSPNTWNFENSISSLVFYTRNENFLVTKKTHQQSRISLKSKISQKKSVPHNFIFLKKLDQKFFFNQTELKTHWADMQYRDKNFHINSPVYSKQALTSFEVKKQTKVNFQPLNLIGSGWSLSEKNFRVNLILESNSKFIHSNPSLKLTNENISVKPTIGFFSFFFYDFLSFETKQKFQFKTFSNGWVLPSKPITEGFIKLKTTGEFRRFKKYQNQSISSILKLSDLRTLKLPTQCLKVEESKSKLSETQEKIFQKLKIGQLIRWGQEVYPGQTASCNGRIIILKQNVIIIRLGIPFLASSRGILHVHHNDLIQKDNLLVTLKSRTLQTEDIVQGIPKIEQLFEARETQGGEILTNNVHVLLQNYFVEALKSYSLDVAVSKSVNEIQRFLIDNILEAYLNQGVKISEKHVEIVVKQMTTKVRILNGGYTGLVQGEIVELTWIQELNKKLKNLNLEQATYEPIVLGISKSVLQSESFLLAASFQEVSRVLVRSALSRKTDFLRGLHENVILGQLIPAGTGLLGETRDQINSTLSVILPLKD